MPIRDLYFISPVAVPDTIRVASLGVASNKLFNAAIGANNANITAADGGSVLSPLTLDGSKQLLAGVLGNGYCTGSGKQKIRYCC